MRQPVHILCMCLVFVWLTWILNVCESWISWFLLDQQSRQRATRWWWKFHCPCHGYGHGPQVTKIIRFRLDMITTCGRRGAEWDFGSFTLFSCCCWSKHIVSVSVTVQVDILCPCACVWVIVCVHIIWSSNMQRIFMYVVYVYIKWYAACMHVCMYVFRPN